MGFDLRPILLEYLQKRTRISDAVEVTDYDEIYYSSGGCETCAYNEYAVEIRYTDSHGNRNTYTYDGKFTYLLESLVDL